MSQTSHVKIKFSSDAKETYTEFNGMSEKTQALGTKLSGLATNFKQLDR